MLPDEIDTAKEAGKVKKWLGLAILLALVIVVAGYFVLIMPKYDGAAELDEEREAVEAQNHVLRTQVNRLRTPEAGLPEVRAQIFELRVGMPAEPQVDKFLLIIESLSVEHDVFIKQISAGGVAQPNTVDPFEGEDAEEEEAPSAPSSSRETGIRGWFALDISLDVSGTLRTSPTSSTACSRRSSPRHHRPRCRHQTPRVTRSFRTAAQAGRRVATQTLTTTDLCPRSSATRAASASRHRNVERCSHVALDHSR